MYRMLKINCKLWANILPLILCCALLSLSIRAAEPEKIIPIAVHQKLADKYYDLLARKNKTAEEISHFNIEKITRGLVSLIIIEQALALGGMPVEFDFIITPNIRRSIALVESGSAVMSPQTMTAHPFTKHLLKSSVILEQNSFIKGIYGLASNEELMKVNSLAQLTNFSAVTNAAWRDDINVLKAMNISRITLKTDTATMFKVIKYRGIDFTLLELSSNLAQPQSEEGIELVRVPDVAIALGGSRHFMISKNTLMVRGSTKR